MSSFSRRRVLHVVWNLIRGGTEGQCAHIAMYLAGRGHVSRVAAFRPEGYFLPRIESVCGPVFHFDIRRRWSLRTLGHIGRLRRYIRDEQIELVHAWDADAVIFGSLAARWAGVPFITSRRDLSEIYPDWKLRAMHRADLQAAAVVVNAGVIRQQRITAGLPVSRVRVIPNLLDLDAFDQASRHPFPGLSDGVWIAMVARLDPEKDIDVFIRAAAQLKERHPQARFAVAGDGGERNHLHALASELGVSDRVRFFGERNDVPALLNRCAIGVLTPKANEGLSNTILEYMATGIPVVATDCGGNQELIRNDQTGFLVPPGDVQEVAASLDTLLNDPAYAQRLGAAARTYIESAHRIDQVGAQFEDLYTEMVGRHN